MSEYIYYVESY